MMEIIVGGVASGKTTGLIRRSSNTGAIIVCCSKRAVERIIRQSGEMSLTVPKPLTYGEYLDKRLICGMTEKVLIDDLECFLAHLVGGRTHVEAVTVDGNRSNVVNRRREREIYQINASILGDSAIVVVDKHDIKNFGFSVAAEIAVDREVRKALRDKAKDEDIKPSAKKKAPAPMSYGEAVSLTKRGKRCRHRSWAEGYILYTKKGWTNMWSARLRANVVIDRHCMVSESEKDSFDWEVVNA